jgi:hypothetical protein
MKARIFYWSITSALAGFLFGFDTVVISGAEQTIQKLWGLSAGLHGLATRHSARVPSRFRALAFQGEEQQQHGLN